MADDQAFQGQMLHSAGSSDYDAMAFVVQQILNRTATASLVQVKAVHGGGLAPVGLVDVQPMVHQVDGYGQAVPHGIIPNLPYLRIQGGNCAVIVDPQVGDIGLAWFTSHDSSTVKKTKAPSLPGTRRRFDWADGLYAGGFLNGLPANYLQISPDGITLAFGAVSIVVTSGGMTFNSPVTHFTGDITTGAGSTFNGKSFDTHTHSGVQTGSGASGPPS